MIKPKIGIVGVCSPVESGGQRYDELIASAEKAMTAVGMDVVVAERSVWNASDAIKVCDQFKTAGIEAIAIMDVTWVMDSLKYLFIHELKVPTVFWAVPYPETFSIGCIQNFGSVLKCQNIPFEYVYGLADDTAVIEKIKNVAITGNVVKDIHNMRIALVGPRQTWRVAGPQDMSIEEWEFSEKLGVTIIHAEMEEITDVAEKISDDDAYKTLETLRSRTGKVLCSDKCMLWMAKVYMATKNFIDTCGLDGIAAECYPNYGGLMNQTSSWLADEGYVVDTEGDIAHTVVQIVLNRVAGGGACALGEIGAFDDKEDYLTICHEGSSAASLADSIEMVVSNPSGDMGSFVGVPLKAMDKVTFCDMQGSAGNYRLMIASGSTLPVSHEEWIAGGEKLVFKLRADGVVASKVVDGMINAGMHHHIVIKEGDYVELLKTVCKYMDISVVTL
jgi:L-fucose isomerase-like protein